MPEAPAPEGLPDRDELRGHKDWAERPIEIRSCDPSGEEPAQRYWLRPRGALPEDPLVHAALLVYASDRSLMSTASRPHDHRGRRRSASLDHAVWLHRPPRFDDWHLYVTESPVAHDARALCLGAFYTPDGKRIATVAQEGLLRYVDEPAR
jgi:acyl-CoA thioesterase-2